MVAVAGECMTSAKFLGNAQLAGAEWRLIAAKVVWFFDSVNTLNQTCGPYAYKYGDAGAQVYNESS